MSEASDIELVASAGDGRVGPDARPTLDRGRPRTSRLVAAVAGSLAVAGGLFAVLAATGDSSLDGEAVWDRAATVIGGEARPGVFWTGSEVIVMRTENGGKDVTGERWMPDTNEARPIAASGLTWRVGPAMAWTGDEVLVVGGSSGPGFDQIGAAYDPAADSWRPIADPPGQVDPWDNAIGGSAVWTGDEMILWRSALAYAPATDSWRTIAEPPLSPRARPAVVWTGSSLVVWGGCHGFGSQCDETNTGLLGDGASYDPATDSWVPLPASPLTPAVHIVAGWTGSALLIVVTDPGSDTGELAAALDPEALEWTALDAPPLGDRRWAAGAWAGDRFVIWGGADGDSDLGTADGAIFDPAAGRWSTLPDGPGPGRLLHSMILAGDRLYVSASRTAGQPLQLRLSSRGP